MFSAYRAWADTAEVELARIMQVELRGDWTPGWHAQTCMEVDSPNGIFRHIQGHRVIKGVPAAKRAGKSCALPAYKHSVVKANSGVQSFLHSLQQLYAANHTMWPNIWNPRRLATGWLEN